VLPALTVIVAGENAKSWIATTVVATGASGAEAVPDPAAGAIGIPGITGAGAGCSAPLAGPPQPATIATPAAATAITSFTLNGRMMIDSLSAGDPADAGLTSR
jgi:hypothetical protein